MLSFLPINSGSNPYFLSVSLLKISLLFSDSVLDVVKPIFLLVHEYSSIPENAPRKANVNLDVSNVIVSLSSGDVNV